MDLAFRYVLGADGRITYGWLALATLLPSFGVTAWARFGLGWSWWGVWALALALGTFLSGVFTVAAGRMLFDRAATPRAILGAYAGRLPTYLAAMIASRGLTLLGWFLMVPGLLAWMRFAFVSEAVLLEQVPARRALARSSWLSTVGADDVLGALVSGLLMSLAIVLGIETLCLAIAEDVLQLHVDGSRLLEDGGSYFALLGYFLSLPWAATSRFLSYIDGRTRQDGWDVQVRMMALDTGEPA
jgi:hypothetical protein